MPTTVRPFDCGSDGTPRTPNSLARFCPSLRGVTVAKSRLKPKRPSFTTRGEKVWVWLSTAPRLLITCGRNSFAEKYPLYGTSGEIDCEHRWSRHCEDSRQTLANARALIVGKEERPISTIV